MKLPTSGDMSRLVWLATMGNWRRDTGCRFQRASVPGAQLALPVAIRDRRLEGDNAGEAQVRAEVEADRQPPSQRR